MGKRGSRISMLHEFSEPASLYDISWILQKYCPHPVRRPSDEQYLRGREVIANNDQQVVIQKLPNELLYVVIVWVLFEVSCLLQALDQEHSRLSSLQGEVRIRLVMVRQQIKRTSQVVANKEVVGRLFRPTRLLDHSSYGKQIRSCMSQHSTFKEAVNVGLFIWLIERTKS